MADLAAFILDGVDDSNVVVGPITWQPSDGITGRRNYFMVCTSEAGRGFRCDQITIEDDDDRVLLIAELARHPPRVIHECDDELYMARLCERLWPGDRISALRAAVERERADNGR